ncbi:MAG: redoxin domain-containing protein [Bacteroidetes bacterium]|nr:redoxin domain-containing protein [Bacteroidota bacterium]
MLIGFTVPAFAQEGYNIKVKVNGVKDSLCYLANYFGDKQYLKDSCKADASGNFAFKGAEKLAGGIYLIVVPGKKYFELIIDKEQNFSVETVMDDFVANMKIKGSNENTIFYDYLHFIAIKSKEVEPLKIELESAKDNKAKTDEIRSKIIAIDSAVVKYKNEFEQQHPEMLLTKVFRVTDEVKLPEKVLKADGTVDSLFMYQYYKQHFFDHIDLTDDRLLLTPVFHPKLEQYFKKLTLQMPDSINKEADHIISQLKPGSEMFKYVVWWITNSYETSNIMGMDAVFVHMAENYYTKEKAFWIDDTQLFKIQDRAKVLKPILIGAKVKNLTLKDSLGVPKSLYDIKVQYTILYFWDPDCGHCQKVTPKLKDYYDKVKSKGVQVYAVCTEVEMDKWKKYISEKKLDWINVADAEIRNNFRHDFDISSTPQIFLLDENKCIVAKRIEVESLEEILTRKFDEKALK